MHYLFLALAVSFIISFLKEVLQQEKLEKERKRKQADKYTECPYCAELIKKKAKVCKHRGRDVIPKEIEM